jgi:hypothetical protein
LLTLDYNYPGLVRANPSTRQKAEEYVLGGHAIYANWLTAYVEAGVAPPPGITLETDERDGTLMSGHVNFKQLERDAGLI